MQKPKQFDIVRNILILTALVGLVLFSWLFGHILRYSIPALWHPPVQETNPKIKVGMDFELEGIRRLAVFPGLTANNVSAQSQFIPGPGAQSAACLGYTYYTSLPAKCRTVDGRLVVVREFQSNLILIPEGK